MKKIQKKIHEEKRFVRFKRRRMEKKKCIELCIVARMFRV